MAIQPTPPIQLDPSMDTGHQLAFTNQNFNNIASVIGQNSFVIVKSDTVTLPAAGGTTNTHLVVSHNLGFIPVFIAYTVSGTSYYPLPYITTGSAASGGTLTYLLEAYTDSTNIYFDGTNYTANSTNNISVKYYLLQQTAN